MLLKPSATTQHQPNRLLGQRAERCGAGGSLESRLVRRSGWEWPVACILLAITSGCRPTADPPGAAADLFATGVDTNGETLFGSGEASWTTVTRPREFTFPEDHGSHEDFRIEWWYYTGNLTATNGRRFGYQLTFFRTGVHQRPKNDSRWAIRNLYTAHFAVSDVKRKQHLQAQRNNRGAVGQAGAETGQLHVWNGDWSVTADGDAHQLVAEHQGARIELRLTPQQAITPHGDQGLSQKGAEEGNASYYYSYTDMSTEGTISIDGKTWEVSGQSWMDHEFSTSFLEPGQLGWDWFALQLDNGTELMLYRMRRDDGSTDPFSSGSFVDREGQRTHLTSAEFSLEPKKWWKSPRSGAEYPLTWKIHIARLDCELEVQSAFADQEMRTGDTTGITYWEGAIETSGQLQGAPVRGVGYLELTGYVGLGLGAILD